MEKTFPSRILGLSLESCQGLSLHDHNPAEDLSQCQLLIKGFCTNLLAHHLRSRVHSQSHLLRVYTYIDKYLFPPNCWQCSKNGFLAWLSDSKDQSAEVFTIWDCVVVDLAACQSSLAVHGTLSVFLSWPLEGQLPDGQGNLERWEWLLLPECSFWPAFTWRPLSSVGKPLLLPSMRLLSGLGWRWFLWLPCKTQGLSGLRAGTFSTMTG